MSILKNATLVTLIVMLILLVAACVGRASADEIEAACQHLESLKTGQSPDEEADRLNKCKEDLGRERVSSEAAQCRAKAGDLDTFWNRCR